LKDNFFAEQTAHKTNSFYFFKLTLSISSDFQIKLQIEFATYTELCAWRVDLFDIVNKGCGLGDWNYYGGQQLPISPPNKVVFQLKRLFASVGF
jgi:hypothetical protein